MQVGQVKDTPHPPLPPPPSPAAICALSSDLGMMTFSASLRSRKVTGRASAALSPSERGQIRPVGRIDAHVVGVRLEDRLRAVLAALGDRPKRFIYISSTGVYGDADGAIVDEDTPCRPRRSGGLACLAAECLLAAGLPA